MVSRKFRCDYKEQGLGFNRVIPSATRPYSMSHKICDVICKPLKQNKSQGRDSHNLRVRTVRENEAQNLWKSCGKPVNNLGLGFSG